MRYTVDQLSKKIEPIAKKYELQFVYLFGSYARDEATDNSDVDILIDMEGSRLESYLDLEIFREELETAIFKNVDLVTIDALENKINQRRTPGFKDVLYRERVSVYEGKSR